MILNILIEQKKIIYKIFIKNSYLFIFINKIIMAINN